MGEVFAGRFELLEPVAEGGMGSVWKVRDRRDGEVYAGKLLRQSDAGSLLRFMREQATRIDHPHVVTPLSWAGEDDRVMFTMALVRGGSVATLLGDHGPLPASWVVEILGQTLEALEAVHAAGVVHRDLKPANLLLEATGEERPHVRVTDFGIAAGVAEPRLTRGSQVIGSPGYLAPEQAAGADPDPRQDLYALGMCGLEMLTGERPPGSLPAARELIDRDSRHGPVVDLLAGAVATDPAARPATAREFREALGATTTAPDPPGEAPFVFDQLSGAVAAEPAGGPAPRSGSGRERLAGLVLLVVGVVAAAAALWLLLSA